MSYHVTSAIGHVNEKKVSDQRTTPFPLQVDLRTIRSIEIGRCVHGKKANKLRVGGTPGAGEFLGMRQHFCNIVISCGRLASGQETRKSRDIEIPSLIASRDAWRH